MFKFTVTGKLPGFGRTGTFSVPHGTVTTPVFMPVGTAASVNALDHQDLESVGAQIILANAYHLYLRPGSIAVKNLGGIHKFMHWPHPILTDSGGFQIQSLGRPKAGLCKITDQGAEFRSHHDGSSHLLTPEAATAIQIEIGADIIMAFDHSVPADADYKTAKEATDRTHRWLTRCINTWKRNAKADGEVPDQLTQPAPNKTTGKNKTSKAGEYAGKAMTGNDRKFSNESDYRWSGNEPSARQALFGIIQGGNFADLRRASAEFVISQNLPGIAIGGASVGKDPAQTSENIHFIRDLLPTNIPLYAMGVGVRPSDAIEAIKAGADMFDCVAPTRLARCGQLYNRESKSEYIDIGRTKFKLDPSPVDLSCDCSTCSQYTRAYLHHLFKSRELLYYRLATIHNLRTMIRTVANFRTSR